VDTPQGAADAVSRWIADSAKWIENKHHPTLSLIYLPHLDYNLQRHGPYLAADVRRRGSEPANVNPPPHVGGYVINPAIHRDLREIDSIVGELIDFFQQQRVQIVLLSEYGITNVNNTVHLNRIFRKAGWLTTKDELGREILDCGASKVFAVADHQVAHVYVNDAPLKHRVRELLQGDGCVRQCVRPLLPVERAAASERRRTYPVTMRLGIGRIRNIPHCVCGRFSPGITPVPPPALHPSLSVSSQDLA